MASLTVTFSEEQMARIERFAEQYRRRIEDNGYSHRNGETTPPSVRGRYWFSGTLNEGGTVIKSMVIVQTDEKRGVLLYPDFIDGWFTKEELTGQWWGPIVPPWESNG